MKKSIPFMQTSGADPSATMKGDLPQTVQQSTRPGTKPVRPVPVSRSGQFNLKPRKR